MDYSLFTPVNSVQEWNEDIGSKSERMESILIQGNKNVRTQSREHGLWINVISAYRDAYASSIISFFKY